MTEQEKLKKVAAAMNITVSQLRIRLERQAKQYETLTDLAAKENCSVEDLFKSKGIKSKESKTAINFHKAVTNQIAKDKQKSDDQILNKP